MNFIRRLCVCIMSSSHEKLNESTELHQLNMKDIEMNAATYENSPTFVPEIKTGKIVRVYDGDTVTIATRIQIDGTEIPKIFRFSLRLRGIDSPELKTKNQTEKTLAIQSRDALSGLIMGKTMAIENVDYDKYGRILADMITPEGINVSEWMLDNGLAVKYDGGTKHRPTEWTTVKP